MADNARLIENLIYTYAERIDAGDFEGVAELFTHGRIAGTAEATPEQMIAGRDGVLALYRGTTRLYEDGTPHTRHVTSNAIIEVDAGGERAAARTCYTVFQRLDDFPLQPIISGRYRDTFHRVDGKWWFDTRIMFVDLLGDLSRHLLIDLG